MRQGDIAREFFMIIEGKVRIERDGKTLKTLGPGDYLGEVALLSESPRTATAVTEGPTKLMVITHQGFNSLIDAHPAIRASIFEGVAVYLRSLVPDSAGLIAQTTRRSRRSAISVGGCSRARRGSRRCARRGPVAASGSTPASPTAGTGSRPAGSTPQAGCVCSTVMPSATAASDAKASAIVLIGPHGIEAAPSAASQAAAPRSRNRASRIARSSERWVTRSPLDAKRGSVGELRAVEHLAEPLPLALGARRPRRSGRRRSAKVSYGTMFGCALPSRSGDRAVDERVLGLVDEAGQRGAEQRDVDLLAARRRRPAPRRARDPAARPARRPPRACRSRRR